MDYIFKTGENSRHMLYSIERNIVLRRLQAEFISHPIYLTRDYGASLNAALMENMIYYTYITVNGTLYVKRISSSSPVFELQPDELHRFEQPYLTVFEGRLILFYCVEKLEDNCFDIRYAVSPEMSEDISSAIVNNSQTPVSYPDIHASNSASNNNVTNSHINTGPYGTFINTLKSDLISPPLLSVLNTGSHLLICIQNKNSDNNEKHLLELTKDFSVISHDEINDNLEQQSRWQLERIDKLQSDMESLQQASSLMMNKISSLLEENNSLIKENESQCEKIKALTLSLTETKKALTIREAQIESAKTQYNNLMEVAEKYRDEAIKWRMKIKH